MFNELKKLSVNNPLFEGFSEELFADLDRRLVGARSFEPDEFLLRQGDESREVFIIESGRVEILVQEEDTEKMHALATLGPGDCVGEVALLDSEPRSASARA
ncbi:MAG: cyclic nucleotide-binding domain-containing protein, partial [Myxococcota bacterium]|nr:cyclic nucleotide-binding domain-containing protein [Myxococcota bacterium]